MSLLFLQKNMSKKDSSQLNSFLIVTCYAYTTEETFEITF